MVLLYGVQRQDGRACAPLLLSQALWQQYGLTQPEIMRAAGGKPYLPASPDIHFNISHSGGLALCGIGDTPIGVDVELIRARSEWFPRRTLSPREYHWFVENGRRWEDFYTLWTLKESLCKCTGQGLSRPARLEVPLLSPGGAGTRGAFTYRSYGGNTWRAAACTVRGGSLPCSIAPLAPCCAVDRVS